MAIVKTKIELSENELKEVLAKHFRLELKDSILTVLKYDGERGQSGYTEIHFEAKPLENNPE